MTKVVCSQDGDTYRIECQGHATGSELVCAAVSVLVTTLAGYLENELVNSKHKLTMGDCLVEMQTTDPAAIGAWRATVFGLMQLENSFPDYIQVTS